MNPYELSRRKFIGNACAAVGATGLLSALAQLRLIGAVAADSTSSSSSYKALVCFFLYGGNDSNNVLIPYDNADYASYASQRTALAIPQANLLPIKPKVTDGRSWALHPSMPEVQSLFGAGNLAILANTGSLVQPVTLAQYNSGNAALLPPQLFSHADQQVQWQSSIPDQPFQSGWGGRLADMVNAMNSNPKVSMSISVAGENSFQIGNTVSQFAVNPSGAVTLSNTTGGTNPVRYTAEQNILTQQDVNLFQAAFGGVTNSAIGASNTLNTILSAAPTLKTVFPTTSLGTQLQMISKMIATAPQLGLTRQIFFASLGGWDLHSGELPAHATLLQQISQALNAFYSATVELGVQNQVTTFTASDFNRTYNTNGDGSDHGWGSHHMIMGGAVQGGALYGTVPTLVIGGPNDTGRGRWIPTTSVDQYSATLASWFGVTPTNLPIVLPNIGRFATANLGFLG